MQTFSFNTTTEIRFSAGALAQADFRYLGAKLLLITDKVLRDLGVTAGVEARLADRVVIFDTVESDPSLETVMAAVEIGANEGVTGVIGLGGGSSMDVAKLAALLLGSGEDLDAAWGVRSEERRVGKECRSRWSPYH